MPDALRYSLFAFRHLSLRGAMPLCAFVITFVRLCGKKKLNRKERKVLCKARKGNNRKS